MVRNFSYKEFNSIIKLQRYNPPRSLRSWGRYISQIYEGRCIVTGKSSNENALEFHHIVSNALVEANQVSPQEALDLKLSVLNGITLEKTLHKRFHAEYGNKVTPLMFISFLTELEREDSGIDKQRIKQAKSWILCLYRELTLNFPVVRSFNLNSKGNGPSS